MPRSISISLLVSVLLASCGPTVKEKGLPAAEVMRLAAQKSSELQSARFAIKADFRTQRVSFPSAGTATLTGVLQDGGNSVEFQLAVDALVSPQQEAGRSFRLLADTNIVLLGKEETYLRLNTLKTDPDQNLFQQQLLTAVLGKWWLFPGKQSASAGVVAGSTITPSPNLLKAQSQVVRIRRDDGLTILDGKRVYHVLVEIDPVKLVAYLEQVAKERNESFDRTAAARTIERLKADGELWVDAETFVLRRISWNIESLEEENGMIVSGSFAVDISDHNTAPPIIPPVDAKVLSPQVLFGVQAGPTAGLPSGDLQNMRAFVSDDSSPRSN